MVEDAPGVGLAYSGDVKQTVNLSIAYPGLDLECLLEV